MNMSNVIGFVELVFCFHMYKCFGRIKYTHLKVVKECYHPHNKFVNFLVKLSCFNVLEQSCSFIDRIWPLACSISHICFGCFWCNLPRISRDERNKQFIPSRLWNLNHSKKNFIVSNRINKKINSYVNYSNNNTSAKKVKLNKNRPNVMNTQPSYISAIHRLDLINIGFLK
jgi:hypothetical protein